MKEDYSMGFIWWEVEVETVLTEQYLSSASFLGE